MSQIHVPIDISNLSGVIPPGDDILYSTLCTVEYIKILPGDRAQWESHLLITRSGFAAFTLIEKETKDKGEIKYTISKKGPFIPEFVKWEDLRGAALKKVPFTKDIFSHVLTNKQFVTYKVKFDEKFESKQHFKQRSNEFGGFCRILWEKRREELSLNK